MLHYLLIMFMLYVASVESKSLRSNEASCPGVYSCANCTAVRLCNPVLGSGYIEYQTANCTGNTPYCDSVTGTCVSSPSSECATTDEFTCLKDGSFPHPTACNKYYQCQNLKSHSYTCVQSYYYYDSVSESCIYNKGCYRFTCTGYNGYKTPYPKDPSIYAYCVNGVATLVDRCFGKYELNVTSQLCQPVCKHEGLIANADDCTTYYRCDPVPYVSDQYVMSLAQCPKGEAYSPNDFQCLPTASVPWCKVPATTTATPE